MAQGTKEKPTVWTNKGAVDDELAGILQATKDKEKLDDMMSQPDNADVREAVGMGEQEASNKTAADEDIFGYLRNQRDPETGKPLLQDSPPGKQKGGWLGRHKGIAGGGIAAIVTIGGFFSIAPPLKLQGILSAVTDHGTVRMEGYIERRMRKVVLQAITKRVLEGDKNVVSSKSMIGSIAKTMSASKYENRLAAQGIKFFKEGDAVKVDVRDASPELREKLKRSFKNVDDLDKFLEDNPATKKIMKAVIRQDLKGWGFFMRGNMVSWMMKYLGIKKMGKEKKPNADTTNADDKIAQEVAEEMDNQAARIGRAVDDLMSIPDRTSSKPDATPATAVQTSPAARQTAKTGVGTSLKEALGEIKGVGKLGKEALQDLGAKLSEKVLKNVIVKAGSKAIPYYGWAVLAAQIFLIENWLIENTTSGEAFRMWGAIKGVYMASVFATWAGIANSQKLGELDHDLMNFYAPFLDGVEESAAYVCMDSNWKKTCEESGIPIPTKLDEQRPGVVKMMDDITRKYTGLSLNQVAKTRFLIPGYTVTYLLSKALVAIDNLLGDAIIEGLKLVFSSVTWLYELIPADIREQFGEMVAATGIEEWLQNFTQGMFQVILGLLNLDYSPFDGGAKLMPMLMAGQIFVANRSTESLGGHKLSLGQVNAQNQRYLAEEREYIKDQGLLYALFSPEVTDSVTSRLLARTPYAPGPIEMANGTLKMATGLIKSSPNTIASIVGGTAYANEQRVSPEEIYNAVPIGFTDEELEKPIHKLLEEDGTTAGQCPTGMYVPFTEIPLTFDNPEDVMCLIDFAVADAAICAIDETTFSETSPTCNPDAAVSGGDPGVVAPGECAPGTSPVNMPADIKLCAIPGTVTTPSSATYLWKDSRFNGVTSFYNAQVESDRNFQMPIVVSDTASASLLKVAQAAQASGVTLTATAGYRSTYEQCSIYLRAHSRPAECPSWIPAVNGNWITNTMKSPHIRGIAIDLVPQSKNWMKRCVGDSTDGIVDNRCFGWYDDVYQKDGWDAAHFSYRPVGGT